MQNKTKERPILFSSLMVQAIVEGRKTMTRRVIKPQPTEEGWLKAKQGITSDITHEVYSSTNYKVDKLYNSLCIQFQGKLGTVIAFHQPNIKCPYGQVGDILWVRESWNTLHEFTNTPGYKVMGKGDFVYKADGNRVDKWKPSIHMPKEACRIYLRITDIKVERVLSISEEDAINEGIEREGERFKNYQYDGARGFETAYFSFRTLWEKINGEESWQQNPYVWAISFERIEKSL